MKKSHARVLARAALEPWRKPVPEAGQVDIQVRRYSGEKDLQRGLTQMMSAGYRVQDQSSRKALYSAAAGLFTRKQIHTVTFVKDAPVPSRPD